MSKYRSLFTEENNVHTPLLAVSHQIFESQKNAKISPDNPVPESIPSQFSQRQFIKENTRLLHQPANAFEINAGAYNSLRWYGNGPY